MKTTPEGSKEKTRLYFYTCEKNKGDKKMMIQQRLYFKTTKDVEDNKSGNDTM